MNQTIDPFLWFEKDAEAAVDFYMSVFDDAAIAR
jgi:predicted 3-demethylubiquinone-9 3-methyltransferase (glyoxalase superfamily)